TNPATSGTSLAPYPMATDPSVAFDRNERLYVLQSQHTTDNLNGALVLNTFDFSGNAPTSLVTDKAVYQWVGIDGVTSPIMAVDDGTATFSDQNSINQTVSQDNPFSNNVYVAWSSIDTPSTFQAANPGTFNANRIRVTTSSDGGNSFSGIAVVNSNNNI